MVKSEMKLKMVNMIQLFDVALLNNELFSQRHNILKSKNSMLLGFGCVALQRNPNSGLNCTPLT